MSPTQTEVIAAFDSFKATHVPAMALQQRLRQNGFDIHAIVNCLNDIFRENILWQNDRNLIYRPTETDKNLSEQWELARRVYAWHQLLNVVLENSHRRYVTHALERATKAFVEKGGTAKTGIGPLGDKGPLLELSNGSVVRYDTGKPLVENLAAEMRAECR